MRLDTDQSVGTIYQDEASFRHAMVCISERQTKRSGHREWASRLRFLWAPGTDATATEAAESVVEDSNPHDHENDRVHQVSSSGDTDDDCICNAHPAEVFELQSRRLRVTRPSDLTDCVHYVAVSYCWSSERTDEDRTYTVETSHGTRQNKAPSSVLARVLRFARNYNNYFIWIDQECIEQDDPSDQQEGIQSMDLVYQRAQISVGILDVTICDQAHLDALDAMMDGGDLDDDLALALAGCLEHILSDRWFTRAWCLQESFSGGKQMTLIVQCLESLSIPDSIASADRTYIELELSPLHLMMSSWLPTVISCLDPTEHQEVQTRLQAVMTKWFAMMPPEVSQDFDPDTRAACNASEALEILALRQNTVISDRLAILANLCNYEIRLDTASLDKLGYDFSICALTLSALNGDMSAFSGFGDTARGLRGSVDSITSDFWRLAGGKAHGFSWCLPRSAKVDGMVYIDRFSIPLRADTAGLDHAGLMVRGWLWVVGPSIDLEPVRRNLLAKWTADTMSAIVNANNDDPLVSEDPRLEPLRYNFVLDCLSHLHRLGQTCFLHLLWRYLRMEATQRQLREDEHARDYAKAAFQDVMDVDTHEVLWTNPYVYGESRQRSRDHPFQTFRGSAIVQWLLHRVLHDGKISPARLHNAVDLPKNYTALFETGAEGELFLSPCTNFAGTSTREQYRWQPSSWRVSQRDGSMEDNALQCRGLFKGLWLAEDNECESFRLT